MSEQRREHSVAQQFLFVLAGRLSIELDGALHELGAQTGLEIPRGVSHQVMNDSDGGAGFPVVSQPPSHGDRS